jgi:hypothetical protein
MEIGDKVKFNIYVPISEDGNTKLIDTIITHRLIDPSTNEEQSITRKVKASPWNITRTDSTVSWNIRKIEIPEKEGIYIGSLRKKLSRSYKSRIQSSITDTPVTPVIGNRLFEVEWVSRPRPRNWTSRNPRRIDNPNKLDELAIIAVSKSKRYVVDMKDLVEYNIKNKVKII